MVCIRADCHHGSQEITDQSTPMGMAAAQSTVNSAMSGAFVLLWPA